MAGTSNTFTMTCISRIQPGGQLIGDSTIGTAVASERPIVDSSFDVALVISFTDKAALDSYLTHPLHVQLVEQTLKPLVERILVYDFSSD